MTSFTAILTFLVRLSLFLLEPSSAQQFLANYHPINGPGITDSCYAAINSTLDCPLLILQAASGRLEDPTATQVDMLCRSECLESLLRSKKNVDELCSSDMDVVWDSHDLLAFPAASVIDNLIYAFNTTCLKDSVSGKLCASILRSWAPEDDRGRNCAPCALEMMRMKLQSPLQYPDDDISSFASLTSSCSATGYTVTAPPPSVTLNKTHPDRARHQSFLSAPTPTCVHGCRRHYRVGGIKTRINETYNSVAADYNSSAFWLSANEHNPNLGLKEIIPFATDLCLPSQLCQTYTVAEDETCDDIVSKVIPQINNTQLESWNPSIEEVCGNPTRLAGSVICISSPPERHSGLTKMTSTATTSSGCRDRWSSLWPGKPYNPCSCPFAPSSCYTQTTVFPEIEYSAWVRCYAARKTPLTDAFCSPTMPTPSVAEVPVETGPSVEPILRLTQSLTRDD